MGILLPETFEEHRPLQRARLYTYGANHRQMIIQENCALEQTPVVEALIPYLCDCNRKVMIENMMVYLQ